MIKKRMAGDNPQARLSPGQHLLASASSGTLARSRGPFFPSDFHVERRHYRRNHQSFMGCQDTDVYNERQRRGRVSRRFWCVLTPFILTPMDP
jgi:hypothetical protein